MIESREKRERLTQAIEYWCKHIRIEDRLRDGDINGLVSSILTEFYHIQLSCGHLVNSMDESIPLVFKDFITDRGDREHGGRVGEIYGDYCKDCADEYKKKLGAKEVKR